MVEHFTSAVLESGLNVKEMVQISMDGPNVNWAFYDIMKKKMCDDHDSSLINIGSCGLHVVHNSFKTGAKATGWKISDFLLSLYYLFKDSPARREDFQESCGNAIMPLKFVNHRWLENVPVCTRALEILPSIAKYVKAVEEKKFTKPSCKSFEIVYEVMKDKLLTSKFKNF